MAYTIFNTRNNSVAVVEDGTIDNTTDLKLIGKNYAGYGEIQNENFIYLLENFAGANQPPRPITGQLWFDTTDKKLKVYDGNDESVFVPLGNVHVGALPSGAAITAANVNKGDFWFDDVNGQVYIHNGATSGDPFVLVGPKGSATDKTIVEDADVYDNLFAGQADDTPYRHKILKGYVDDIVVFIASNDEFTLDDSNPISGFDRIKKGITLVNTENANDGVTSGNYNFWGNASNALRLGGTLAQEFVERSSAVFTGEVNIDDNDGLLIGPNNELLLKVTSGEDVIESTITNGKLNFKVKDAVGTTVTPVTIASTGLLPSTDNSFNVGSSGLRWDEVYAVNFRGIADNANAVLSDGTFKTATKNNTNETLVTRDSVGDIFGTAFRGTAIYNAADQDAAVTGRVTKADGVQVDGTTTYIGATTTSTASKLAARDANGDLFANQFNGLATRASRLQVSTGIDQYEYRAASVANLQAEPNTVAVRDETGRLHAQSFVGALTGTANSAAQWSTPRTLTVNGDASGNVLIDGSSDVTLTLTIGNNKVALGTDTTGNYVQNVSVYNSDPYLNVYVNNTLDGPGSEEATVQLGVDADVNKTANSLVARGASNEINVGDVTADDIDGAIITASNKFVGDINEVGTTHDGWFDNLTVGTINAGSISYTGATLTPIANGGTNANNATDARTNLDVYSKSEVDTQITNVNNAIGSISSTTIENGTSRVLVGPSSDIYFRVNGVDIASVTGAGIELEPGFEFVGTATSAEYADLAEKYTTEGELVPGTVVAVSADEGAELKAVGMEDFPVGVVSTDPAFLMNSSLENGTAIALKGRVPTRVVGAVNKGDMVFAHDNGTASTNGNYKVGIALESNSDEGEKLVECMLVM